MDTIPTWLLCLSLLTVPKVWARTTTYSPTVISGVETTAGFTVTSLCASSKDGLSLAVRSVSSKHLSQEYNEVQVTSSNTASALASVQLEVEPASDETALVGSWWVPSVQGGVVVDTDDNSTMVSFTSPALLNQPIIFLWSTKQKFEGHVVRFRAVTATLSELPAQMDQTNLTILCVQKQLGLSVTNVPQNTTRVSTGLGDGNPFWEIVIGLAYIGMYGGFSLLLL